MRNIYSVGQEKSLLLYTSRQSLYLRTLQAEHVTEPVILCNDYLSDLSDIVYRDTVYFAYMNTKKDIIVRNIMKQNILYAVWGKDTPECFRPQLSVVGDNLLLFYVMKNPLEEEYVMRGVFPFGENSFQFPGSYGTMPTAQCISVKGNVLLIVAGDTAVRYFLLNPQGECIALEGEESWLSRYAPVWNQGKQNWENKVKMQMQTILQLQKNIEQKDAVLESVRHQYEELVNTATQYRDEAMKWRSRYYANTKANQ